MKKRDLIISLATFSSIIALFFFKESLGIFATLILFFLIFVVTAIIIRLNNKIHAYEISAQNTELKYYHLFAHMSDGVAYFKNIYSDNGIICDYLFLSANASFKKMLNIAEDPTGKTLTQLFPYIRDGKFDWIKEMGELKNPEEAKKFAEALRINARILSVDTFVPEKDHLVVMLDDETDRIQVSEEREKIQKQISYAERLASIGILAAGVGHEINNPLGIIKLNLDDIRDHLDENKINNSFFSERIWQQNEAIVRIADIVKGLSTYARMDVEKSEYADIHEIIRHSLYLIESIYSKENIKIVKVLQSKRPFIYGNTGKLQQVIMNLLGNAKDALATKKGGEIKIETKSDEKNIIISISDTGEGIPRHIRHKIFENFFTTKPPGKGTGLGLSICYSLIAEMNGRIEFETEVGVGSTFTITVPLATPITNPSFSIKDNRPLEEINKKILVVDDEDAMRKAIVRHLKNANADVVEVKNGKLALEELKKQTFDLLITDLKMPELDGQSLIDAAIVANLLTNTAIIVITGVTNLDDSKFLHFTQKLNINILPKPFSKDELFECIEKSFL